MRHSETMRIFSKQMMSRAFDIKDFDSLANTMLSVAGAMEHLSIAIGDIYDILSRIEKDVERLQRRR